MTRFGIVRVLRGGWLAACVACGGGAAPVTGGGEGTARPPQGEVRLESGGTLSDGDPMHGEAYVDEYVIPVEAGEHLVVDLSSESFDPVLRVTPPGGTTLTDDDHQGSRERSHLDLAVAESGSLKVEVTSHQPAATGAYRLRVFRPAAAADAPEGDGVLVAGTPRRGILDDADQRLADGRPVETYTLQQPAGRPTTLRLSGSAEALVMDPVGHQLSLTEGGSLVLGRPGVYRVQLIGRAGAATEYQLAASAQGAAGAGNRWPELARAHHRFPEEGAPAEAVTIGSETRGELGEGATTLPSGETARLYRVPVQPGHELSIDLSSPAFDTYLMVAAPGGEHWENDDAGGGRDSSLQVPVRSRGALWVVVTSYERGETGAFTLKVSETARVAGAAGASEAVSLEGELARGDGVLASGAFVDRYVADLQAGQRIELGVTSSAFDTVLTVTGPNGAQQTNDDIDYDNGNTNSALTYTVQQSGLHQVAVASYRSGERGAYTLTAQGAELRAEASAPSAPEAPSAPGGPNVRTVAGELASGDQTLGSGEFVDAVELDLPAHASVNLRLTSAAFDTYLAVIGPGGERNENDDVSPNDTSSALQLRTQAAGRYRVFVTSYRPGETGPYQLVAQWSGAEGGGAEGTASAPPSSVGNVRGALAQGDSQLQSGEFVDEHTFTLEPGRPAKIEATSTAFDTYLIVQTPSGRQLDNDDVAPNDTNSRVEIPSAEAGEYRVLVTSYRPGETGAYQLSAGAAEAAPVVASGGQGGGRSGAGGRVFGIFAGISDYPGNGNDLPECANDAIKLAETLRESGLMTADRQVVLTDQRATRGAVEAAFRRMAGQMGPSDTFVFFYSGHGGQRMNSSDARELDGVDETLVLYDGEVVDDDVARWFDSVQSLAIVALDACFAGGFAKDVISVPGRMGLFSSQEDVLSAVAAQFQAGGYLSHFLRMAFRGDADQGPRDGVLTAGELSHFVLNQFGSHVRDVQMQDAWQHPVIERGGVRAGLPLLSYR